MNNKHSPWILSLSQNHKGQKSVTIFIIQHTPNSFSSLFWHTSPYIQILCLICHYLDSQFSIKLITSFPCSSSFPPPKHTYAYLQPHYHIWLNEWSVPVLIGWYKSFLFCSFWRFQRALIFVFILPFRNKNFFPLQILK